MEFQITMTLLIVTLFYVLCFLPMLAFEAIFHNQESTQMSQDEDIIELFFYIPYMLPYSTNFLIYVSRNTKYRKALLYFMKECKQFLFDENSEDTQVIYYMK